MKKAFLLLLCLLSFRAYSQSYQLSEQAEITVVTCGPFQGELYSAFGHSAIRIHDPASDIDIAFNYGVFDFDQPNFYLNFARGYLYYKLGVYSYPHFRDFYIARNRYVHEQVLNLTAAQKQKLFEYLEWNAKPENVNYRYDYFYNNCATKIRDVVVEVFKDSVKFDGSYITTDYTIRDLTDIYLERQPWGDLGIDICLGLPMDKKTSPYEYMFLPDYIESGFDHATLNGQPLVKNKIIVYESVPEEVEGSLIHPWVAFGLFFLITAALSYFDWKRKKLSRWFDVTLFSVVGWVGVLLLFLWVATDHKAAATNFNLLWAFPLHAIAAILLLRKKSHVFLVKYFTATEILLGLTCLFWFLLPQQMNLFLMPLVLSLLLRAFLISKLLTSVKG